MKNLHKKFSKISITLCALMFNELSHADIIAPGGSTIYLRERFGFLDYQIDNTSAAWWTNIPTLPEILVNTGLNSSNVEVNFLSGNYLTTNDNEYFIVGSHGINFTYDTSALAIQNGNINTNGYDIGTITISSNVNYSYIGLSLLSFIENNGTINNFTNFGSIIADYTILNRTNGIFGSISNSGFIGTDSITSFTGNNGIYNLGNITGDITNNTGAVILGQSESIYNSSSSTIGSISNSGFIGTDSLGSTYTNDAIYNEGQISNISNAASSFIVAQSSSILNDDNAEITNLTNSGNIGFHNSTQSIYGILNYSNIASLVNESTAHLFGGTSAIYNDSSAVIDTLTNSGTIGFDGASSYSSDGLNNFGTILNINLAIDSQLLGQNHSINNAGVITNLNNGQSNLTFNGNLPANYSVIIQDSNRYGSVSFTGVSGITSFGINNSSVLSSNARYQDVISGLSSSDISNEETTLNYQSGNVRATYQLVHDDNNISNVWDLLILSYEVGPSTFDTQTSLKSLSSELRGTFSHQNIVSNFANMNTYDCNLFDSKGLCISVGGQQTYVDSPSSNMTFSVVVAGYKVSPTLRIGGFLNQNINSHTGSNVDLSNNTPLMGLFAVWNQNENHLGYQVKIANAYQDMDVTTTRDVIGTSEAGKGKTDLNTQSYVGEVSYAFLANEDKTLVRSYAAIRYTRIKQDSYSERTTSAVTAPLTYAALSDRSTVALMGVKLNHKINDKMNLTGSLGVEQDLNHDVDNLTASGVSGLTSENFNNNINRTRPVASIGAYYMPVKNQRIAADIYYQELPFQSTASTTAYVNYMIGF